MENISTQVPGSVQNSTPKAKRKKKKEADDTNLTPQSHSLSMAKAKSTTKKKKKKQIVDTLTYGHCNGDHEEGERNDNCNSTSEVRVLEIISKPQSQPTPEC